MHNASQTLAACAAQGAATIAPQYRWMHWVHATNQGAVAPSVVMLMAEAGLSINQPTTTYSPQQQGADMDDPVTRSRKESAQQAAAVP